MKTLIPVGVLFSQTGATAVIEKTQLHATTLAIHAANLQLAAHGLEIQPFYMDPQSDPFLFSSMSEQLITEHAVNVIFGCYTSISRKSVVPVIEKYNKLLFYPTLYEGFEFSPNVIYTGACPNQNIIILAEFMFSMFGKNVYLIGSDYVYPYESNRIMKDMVKGFGGQIMGEHYLSLDAAHAAFRPLFADIAACKPDFIFSTVVGASTSALYETYAQAGFQPHTLPIASLTTSEAELAIMNPAARANHYTAAPFFASLLKNSTLPDWQHLADLTKEVPVNQCWESAYFQVMLFAKALIEADNVNTDSLLKVLRGMEIDAPQGRIRIDPDNNHCWVYSRIGRSCANGDFEIVKQSKRTVRPDPYLMSYAISAL